MSHLHDRVAALVDGELSPAARCRALAHLDRCQQCRLAVDAERETRRTTAQAVGVEPSPELVARLMALGGPSGPMRPREGHLPGTPRVPALPGPGREEWIARRAVTTPRSVRVRARATTARPPGRADGEPRLATAPPARSPRRSRRGFTAAVLGTVSLATIGMLGISLVGGGLRLPGDDPALGRLVERAGVVGDSSVVLPVSQLTTPPTPAPSASTP